jgi:hypothetical protein
MQKTYWWRVGLFSLSLVILAVSYIGFCDYKIGMCLGGNDILIIRTLFHIFLATLVISSFLFFVSDKSFLKWLRFAVVWIFLSVFLIYAIPEYQGGWISIAPGKELASIWMSELFVILSLGKIVWDSVRQKTRLR